MNEIVRWPPDERFCSLGRNGYGLCTGLDVFTFDDVVELRPITSKNQIGRAEIGIPVTALPRLIRILRGICRTAQGESDNQPSEDRYGNLRRNRSKQRRRPQRR